MLGDKLMKLRKRQGLSQQEVADTIGVTRQTISNWECDQGSPALDKAGELAGLYHIPLNDLVADEIEVVCTEEEALEDKDLHVLRSLIGKTCQLDCNNLEWMAVWDSSKKVEVLDVDKEWVRITYERAKDNTSLFKKETVTQLIELSTINGFTIVESEVK